MIRQHSTSRKVFWVPSMKLDDLLFKLELNVTKKKKVIKRLLSLGMQIDAEAVSDGDAAKVLRDKTNHIQLERYLSDSGVLAAVPYVEGRTIQEIKQLSKKHFPGVLVDYSRTSFAYAPNTYYFLKENTAVIDQMIQIFLSTALENHLIEGISLHSLPADMQEKEIKRILGNGQDKKRQKALQKSTPSSETKPKMDWYSLQDASRTFDISLSVLKENAQNGKLICKTKGNSIMVSFESIDFLLWQRENYIGITHFLEAFCNERFSVSSATHRNKFYDFWESKDFFDMDICSPREIVFEKTGNNFLYLHKSDVTCLHLLSEEFLTEFGLSEEEKVQLFLGRGSEYPKTVAFVREYIDSKGGPEIITPSLTEMVRYIFRVPLEFPEFTKGIFSAIFKQLPTKTAQECLLDFAGFVRSRTKVSFPDTRRNAATATHASRDISAYSFDVVCRFADCLFNETLIQDNRLVEKALENSFFAEMWMYCSLHYVCGWRAGDICEKWMYLSLDTKSFADIGFPEICMDSLKDDILTGSINDRTYEKLTDYVVDKIILAAQLPSKTSSYTPTSLRVSITESLKSHFGRLLLIAEYHHNKDGEGYMQLHRKEKYQNRIRLREFFGDGIQEIFGNHNLSSRRLNKSYLQGIERAARDLDMGGLVAHRVAAYARNHKSTEITYRYLSDHNLFNESPEFVLWSMFERGVMGVIPYTLLNAAFPETFQQLPIAAQTKLIQHAAVPAYALEVAYASQVATAELRETFLQGLLDEPKRLLRAMYQIGQGFGKSKEEGVYCLKRALGEICEHPTWESCIGNNCPYNVFTHQGVPALIEVIQHYRNKYAETGNAKYAVVLKEIILPNFQDILRSLKQDMSREDWIIISGYLKGGLQ